MTEQQDFNEDEARKNAGEFAKQLNGKGFVLAHGIMAWSYDADKRKGDPGKQGRLHISDYAEAAGVSTPTIKNWREAWKYIVTLPDYIEMGLTADVKPREATPVVLTDPANKAKFTPATWSGHYKQSRQVTSDAADKTRKSRSDARTAALNGDQGEAAKVIEELKTARFGWITEATSKMVELKGDKSTVKDAETAKNLRDAIAELIKAAGEVTVKIKAAETPAA